MYDVIHVTTGRRIGTYKSFAEAKKVESLANAEYGTHEFIIRPVRARIAV